jgi:hypothetical protein
MSNKQQEETRSSTIRSQLKEAKFLEPWIEKYLWRGDIFPGADRDDECIKKLIFSNDIIFDVDVSRPVWLDGRH